MKITFTLNGKQVTTEASPASRLLDILRDDFNLTGVKEGCGEGECGACVVFLDGRLVNSCLIAAGSVQDSEIETIEGFRETERYKVIKESFLDAGAVQCGFCTPGFIMAVEALLRENSTPAEDEIKEALSGNLCRCTGYNMIFEAVKLAARKRGNP